VYRGTAHARYFRATKVGALTKRVAQLYKSMQTNDADRR
jgi:hypothetical protein